MSENDSEKNGTIFIAYSGVEFKHEAIKNVLENKCPQNFCVKKANKGSTCFLKIVPQNCNENIEPFYNEETNILSVSGYNKKEINHPYESYKVFDDMFYSYHEKIFSVFKKNNTHICAVFWDGNNRQFVAGVTEPKESEYTHLYYGYTKSKNELMFSNNREILNAFCNKIDEMPHNTYMKGEVLYTLDGKKVDGSQKDSSSFIRKSRANTDAFIEALNTLLGQLTNDSIKDKIDYIVEQTLGSKEYRSKIEEFVEKDLDLEIQNRLLEVIKQEIEKHSIQDQVKEELSHTEEQVNRQIKEKIEKEFKNSLDSISIPKINIIKFNDVELGRTGIECFHEKFDEILSFVQLDEPVMLIGPAGSGKNYAVGQIADALGKPMYYTNNASNEFKLTGFIDAGGNYRDTEFYKAFKNGGVFFLDEIDNSDPSSLIVLNSAIANGYMAFPHETIDRHKDFRIVAAANTWGKGCDLEYVGRNILDAATLDRFDNVFFDYDKKLERSLYPNDEILEFMWAFRDAVNSAKIPHIVSTRGIGKVYKKEINGLPVETILRTNVIKNLGQDDLNTILGNMKSFDKSNKYYMTAKTLRLTK